MNKLSTLRYLFKNLKLILVVICPAFLLACNNTNKNPLTFFLTYTQNIKDFSIESFFDVYSYFSFFIGTNILLLLISLIVVFAFLGVVFCIYEKKMRLGIDYSLKKDMSYLFDNSILIVFPYALLIMASYEAISVLLSLVIYLLSLLINASTVLFIVSLIISIAIYGLYFIFLVLVSVSIPSLLIDGYSFRFSIIYSISLTRKDMKRVTLSFFIPIVISILFVFILQISLNQITPLVNEITSFIVMGIVWTFWLMYFPLLCMNQYLLLTDSQFKKDFVKLLD